MCSFTILFNPSLVYIWLQETFEVIKVMRVSHSYWLAIFVQPIAAQCWRSRGHKILKILRKEHPACLVYLCGCLPVPTIPHTWITCTRICSSYKERDCVTFRHFREITDHPTDWLTDKWTWGVIRSYIHIINNRRSVTSRPFRLQTEQQPTGCSWKIWLIIPWRVIKNYTLYLYLHKCIYKWINWNSEFWGMAALMPSVQGTRSRYRTCIAGESCPSKEEAVSIFYCILI